MRDFNKIYKEYYNKVLHQLQLILGEQAADYAQEIFIKIYKGIRELKDETKLSSWIYSITVNTARDAMRSIRAKDITVSLDKAEEHNNTEDLHLIDRVADPREKAFEDVIVKKEMSQCYIDFVEKLPLNYYEIYKLSELERLSNAEISEKLSLSIETIKIRLHRARIRLYDELRKNCTCYNDSSGDLLCELNE